MIRALGEIAVLLHQRIERQQRKGRTLTLKVKDADYQQITRSKTMPHPTRELDTLLNLAQELRELSEVDHKAVRLLGLTLSNLDGEGENRAIYRQLCLWDIHDSGVCPDCS